MLEHWPGVAKCLTRTEISRFIRRLLPDDKKKRLEDEGGEPWKNFCDLVIGICKEIGLSPSARGRPKKIGKIGEK